MRSCNPWRRWAVIRAMADLWDIYTIASIESSPSLQDFIEQVLSGQHGSFSAEEIVEFLRKMETAIHSNIDLMAETNPSAASFAEENKKETSNEIARLIDSVQSKHGREDRPGQGRVQKPGKARRRGHRLGRQ